MACCAFALFILGQIAFALERVRNFVFGARSERTEPTPNAVVAWRPGAVVMEAPQAAWSSALRRVASPRVAAMALCLELLVAAGGMTLWTSHAEHSAAHLNFALNYICRGGEIAGL